MEAVVRSHWTMMSFEKDRAVMLVSGRFSNWSLLFDRRWCFAVVGLESGVGCLIEDDSLGPVAFGDLDGFLTLVLVHEDDAVVFR